MLLCGWSNKESKLTLKKPGIQRAFRMFLKNAILSAHDVTIAARQRRVRQKKEVDPYQPAQAELEPIKLK